MRYNNRITLIMVFICMFFLSTSMVFSQKPSLGEVIRGRKLRINKDLNLNKLPSPAEQQASLKEYTEAHWHGLELIPLVYELRQEYNIPADVNGLLIDESILEAAEAGLLAGDVVRSVDGYPVPTLKEFLNVTIKLQEKKRVRIKVWRSAYTQALTGDVGITDNLAARANIMKKATKPKTLTLVLKAAPIYKSLGYADVSSAPPIQPGAISPHKEKSKPCAACHIFMYTGGQLAVDAGDINPNPPAISPGSAAPHNYWGKCNFCHTVQAGKKQKGPLTERGMVPEGQTAAAPIAAGSFAPHGNRGKCNSCHVIRQNNKLQPEQQMIPRGQGAVAPNAADAFAFQQQYPPSAPIQDSLRARPTNSVAAAPHGLSLLGVAGISVTPDIAQRYNLPQAGGVYIAEIDSLSPLMGLGVQPGEIITHLGGISVRDFNHLNEIAALLEPDEMTEITVNRKSKSYTFNFIPNRGVDGHRERFAGREFGTRTFIVVAILAIVYFLIFNNILGRLISFPLGAILILVMGYKFEFYDISRAIEEINFYILIFIIGMNFITAVLYETGFFDYLSKKITLYTRGDRLKLFLLFCLLTYFVSAFVDNIATILVVIPLTLRLARDLHFDPKPLIIGEIISSNLGGASTMFGDFPNLLISLSTGLQFHDFIMYEAPVCILMLCVMFIYMWLTQHDFFRNTKSANGDKGFFDKIERELSKTITNSKAMIKALIVLGLVILGLIFSWKIGVNPAIFAFAGGIIILIISGIPKGKIFKQGGWGDVVFFAALFIMVGAAEASGLLLFLSKEVILKLSAGNILVMAILIICISAFITVFMNAGPTAAIFIPVVIHFGIEPPHYLFWWALSLGVLTGSCASLYGASGGPLAASIVTRYWKKNRKLTGEDSPFLSVKNNLDFREYMKTGGPIMILFLIISIAYISFLYYK